MILKQGVVVRGVRPEMIFGLMIAQRIFDVHGQSLMVTSLVEGNHGEASFHYQGLAVDLRTHSVARNVLHDFVKHLQSALGGHYQVILEAQGLPNEHIHVEFDDGREHARRIEERL
jgi:hypothetical protein